MSTVQTYRVSKVAVWMHLLYLEMNYDLKETEWPCEEGQTVKKCSKLLMIHTAAWPYLTQKIERLPSRSTLSQSYFHFLYKKASVVVSQKEYLWSEEHRSRTITLQTSDAALEHCGHGSEMVRRSVRYDSVDTRSHTESGSHLTLAVGVGLSGPTDW